MPTAAGNAAPAMVIGEMSNVRAATIATGEPIAVTRHAVQAEDDGRIGALRGIRPACLVRTGTPLNRSASPEVAVR